MASTPEKKTHVENEPVADDKDNNE